MKASSLWSGTDYAYQYYLGRGRALPLNAERVKVIELVKEPIPGGQKSRTKVLVAYLDEEGAAITEGPKSHTQYVKASDIINFWDDYEEERKEAKEKQDREREERRIRQEQYERERNERYAVTAVAQFIRNAALAMQRWEAQREEREREELLQKHLTRINNVLITRGLRRNEFGVTKLYVQIPLQEVERWLEIDSPFE